MEKVKKNKKDIQKEQEKDNTDNSSLLKVVEDLLKKKQDSKKPEDRIISLAERVIKEFDESNIEKKVIREELSGIIKYSVEGERISLGYFLERNDIDYDYLFSHMGNNEHISPILYFSAKDYEENTSVPGNLDYYEDHELLNAETRERLVIIHKMDELMGISTGFIPEDVKERHEILNKLSFYAAIMMVTYNLIS